MEIFVIPISIEMMTFLLIISIASATEPYDTTPLSTGYKMDKTQSFTEKEPVDATLTAQSLTQKEPADATLIHQSVTLKELVNATLITQQFTEQEPVHTTSTTESFTQKEPVNTTLTTQSFRRKESVNTTLTTESFMQKEPVSATPTEYLMLRSTHQTNLSGADVNISNDSAKMCNNRTENGTVKQSECELTSTQYPSVIQYSSVDLKTLYEKVMFINEMFIVPILCPIGIVGNSLVAYVLFKKKNYNSSFIYMTFILGGDILSLASDLCLPIGSSLQMTSSETLRKFGAYINFWNLALISVCFRRFVMNVFCVLSYERLSAITRPIHLQSSLTVTHYPIFIVLSFLFSIVYSVIPPLSTELKEIHNIASNTTKYIRTDTSLKKENEQLFKILSVSSKIIFGPVQILFLIILNILIVIGLQTNKKSQAISENNERTKYISRLQKKLCKIFFVLSVFNIAAFLPIQIVLIISNLDPSYHMSFASYSFRLMLFGFHFCRVLNSLTDFVVFLAMSPDVRRDITLILTCTKKPQDIENSQATRITLNST